MVRTIFRPVPVDGNPLAQDTLADRLNADHLTEEMRHLFRARQRAQITAEDNALEAAVDQCVEIADSLVGQSPTTIGIEKPSGQASERWREPPPRPRGTPRSVARCHEGSISSSVNLSCFQPKTAMLAAHLSNRSR